MFWGFRGYFILFAAIGATSLALAGPIESAPRSRDSALRKVAPEKIDKALSGVSFEGDIAALRTAIQRQLDSCGALDPNAVWNFEARRVSRRKWCIETQSEFLKIAQKAASVEEVFRTARDRFDWYQSVGSDGAGLVKFTGYYFPKLVGSRTRHGEFQFPVYRKPGDLLKTKSGWRKRLPNGSLASYFDRREIDEGRALEGRGDEILWVDNYYDLFMFQVQGAGWVELRDERGARARVVLNYAAENGQPYVSPSSVLKEMGVSPEFLTIPGMKRYFGQNPSQLFPVLFRNPSYVFFKEDRDGPYGVDEILLTAGSSIAVDRRVFPTGAMALFRTSRPIAGSSGAVAGWRDFAKFSITQDTGGAIRGAGRVDIYWGEDEYAEFAGGNMHQPGELYFAVVK